MAQLSRSITFSALLVATCPLALAEDTPSDSWYHQAQFEFLNYEWADDQVRGETLLLTQIESRYQQHLASDAVLAVGALGQRYFGDRRAGYLYPLLQLSLQPARKLHINFGTLERDHRAHEFLLARPQIFTDAVEEGVQMTVRSSVWTSDHWLNWKRRESKDQAESFDIGAVNRWEFAYAAFDLQGFANHVDGQMTTDNTSLRAYRGIAGASVRYATYSTDSELGARALGSTYALNGAGTIKGTGVQPFVKFRYYFGPESFLNLELAHLDGENLLAPEGLPTYATGKYSYVELLYQNQITSGGMFRAVARAEQFHEKMQTTQELSLVYQIGENHSHVPDAKDRFDDYL